MSRRQISHENKTQIFVEKKAIQGPQEVQKLEGVSRLPGTTLWFPSKSENRPKPSVHVIKLYFLVTDKQFMRLYLNGVIFAG
jgi:hypothetical protein